MFGNGEDGSTVSTWRVGVVGYGWAAGAHMAAFEGIPGIDVAAVCTARPDVGPASVARDRGHAIEVVRAFEDLVGRSDIDVIDVCSRSNLHATQAMQAARAGKHVIIEKPIALTLQELRDLTSAVTATGVRTCVCFEERFSHQFTATRSLLDTDLIGPLHYAEVDYYHEVGPSVQQYEWNRLRVGGGSSLLSVGCHSVDGLLMFMGSSVTEVTSYATRSPNPIFARYEYPTSSVTIMKFRTGRSARSRR